MSFFSSFTGSFSGGRRTVAKGGGVSTGNYSVSNAVQHNISSDGLELETQNTGIHVDDGLTTFTVARNTVFRQYFMSPAGDWSDVNLSNRTDTSSATEIHEIIFTSNGLTALVGTQPPPSGLWGIDKYTLTTPYDMRTGTRSQNFSVSGTYNMTGIAVNPSGTKLILAPEEASVAFKVYDLSSPYDLTTRTETLQLLANAGSGQPNNGWRARSVEFNNAGTEMFVVRDDGARSGQVWVHVLDTPYDVTSESDRYVLIDNMLSGSNSYHCHISDDETKFYLQYSIQLFEYDLSR